MGPLGAGRAGLATNGPEPPVESVTTLQRGFPEAAAHGLAQQNPGTNVGNADFADFRYGLAND